MPNVAEIIRDHVTLEVRSFDRLYLNAYVPRLQSSGGVVDFLDYYIYVIDPEWGPAFIKVCGYAPSKANARTPSCSATATGSGNPVGSS